MSKMVWIDMDIAILRMLGAHDATTGRRCAAWRATERVVRYCLSPVAPGDIGPRRVNLRTRRQGEQPMGGRKPRFPLGPAQYHRPMWSLFYRVIRILVRLIVIGDLRQRDEHAKDLEILVLR